MNRQGSIAYYQEMEKERANVNLKDVNSVYTPVMSSATTNTLLTTSFIPLLPTTNYGSLNNLWNRIIFYIC